MVPQTAADALRSVRLPDIFNPTKLLPALLGVTAGAIAKMLREGRLGPFIKTGRRGFLQRREALLGFLESQETMPAPLRGRPVPPPAKAEFLALLRSRTPRGGKQ